MKRQSYRRSSGSPARLSVATMVEQGTVLLMVVIGTLILLLALLILFHENANATKGYRLRALELQRSQLLLEEEVLNMQIADQQSLQQLQADPRIESMAATRDPLYIRGDIAVAKGEDARR